MSIQTSVQKLANGVEMPWVGLGVFQAEAGNEVKRAVKSALEAGYRSIDTASFYGNEKSVGEAIKESDIPVEDIFITTKVWNDEQGFNETLEAFERSREKLGVDVIDLYLIHWPVPGKYKETWGALEKLYEEGKVRAIGVSNFTEEHLENVMKTAKVNPMVNQVEFHPRLFQKGLLEYCQNHDIQLEAWRPLGKGDLLGEDVVERIAQKHGKTPAQVLIRWSVENKVVTIPKSVTPERIKANAQVFDFSLDVEDLQAIDGMNENKRYGYHPDEFPYDKV
ncbi:diketogulonate reductase-like aldo/keto reductase [Salibacterium salarium]|uniref:aldo/keto reductase n=1 Tax=Salibacterium salarium TaxID=284579 RepID=UPI00277F4FCC|nr:aldo/keto reductase [Salibacterium salarium]MDQ0297673.1 diketogulonate reductase-like aldo/keto reductase [Salibacterium salarium]